MNTVSPDISPANSWRMSVGHVIKIRSLLSVRGVLIFLSHCNDISFNSSDLPSSLCLFLPSSIIPLWHTHGLLSLVLEAKEKLSNMKLCWVFLWLWLSAFWSVFFSLQCPADVLPHKNSFLFLRGFICCPCFLSIDHSKGTWSTEVTEITKKVLRDQSRVT